MYRKIKIWVNKVRFLLIQMLTDVKNLFEI